MPLSSKAVLNGVLKQKDTLTLHELSRLDLQAEGFNFGGEGISHWSMKSKNTTGDKDVNMIEKEEGSSRPSHYEGARRADEYWFQTKGVKLGEVEDEVNLSSTPTQTSATATAPGGGSIKVTSARSLWATIPSGRQQSLKERWTANSADTR
ncbi:hypothetical protein I203_107604 [Kwoniella mangroviensis CBS 8507]|uniref:hypothetical protein n=1 Tax=Kwoniella mangroviensis CBS 8507 TaxID=1296122 RepID=UPI00080CC33D|nr:uncharacterized protein I203_02352 [Kwoniella mangroviensis CBS 8507]OCF68958.1 hypothetical protein I203_02352 [Kwoniella mangroviensis CBS 8507]